MGRRIDVEPETRSVGEPRSRRRRLQRALLENVALDSRAYADHRARLAKASSGEARLAVYAETLSKAGVRIPGHEVAGG